MIPNDCIQHAIGHRGFSHLYPENSLLALEEAFKHGIKVCEVDVQLTSDSVYVLFHDKTAIHRLTEFQGDINKINYAELAQMKMAAYRDELFSFNRVSSLVDALRLAHKYGAQLYLDTKNSELPLIAKAVWDAGVPDSTALPSLENIGQAQEWRNLMPNGRYVWYGGGALPDNPNNPAFYQEHVLWGAQAFEVGYSKVNEDILFPTFASRVHELNKEVWVFTVNDNALALNMIEKGVDKMESDRPISISRHLCNWPNQLFPDSLTTGNWRFKSNLLSKKIGSQLRYKNYTNPSPGSTCSFLSTQQSNIAQFFDGHDTVMYVPAQTNTEGLLVYSNLSVDDNGTIDGTYSILIDFLLPTGSLGNWIALYQTSVGNSDDADLFINPQGKIGITGDYFGSLQENKWYRLIISADDHQDSLFLYLDGQKIGAIETYGTRWTIFTNSPSGADQGFLLLTDNDGETRPIVISAMQVRGFAITQDIAMAFGKASKNGFKIGNADVYLPKSPFIFEDSTTLDYDNQQYNIVVKSFADLNALPLSFSCSAGSICSVPLSGIRSINNNEYTFDLSSEDGTRQKTWSFCFRQSEASSVKEYHLPDLSLFPNPTKGVVNLMFSSKIKEIKFYNTAGQLMFEKRGEWSSPIQLDLSSFPPGMYSYHIQWESGLIQKHSLAIVH